MACKCTNMVLQFGYQAVLVPYSQAEKFMSQSLVHSSMRPIEIASTGTSVCNKALNCQIPLVNVYAY